MSYKFFWIGAVLLSAVIFYLFDWAMGQGQQSRQSVRQTSPKAVPKPLTIPAAEVLQPRTETVAARELRLPKLDASDEAIGDALENILGKNFASLMLNRDQLIRRIVATIDNLPREIVAVNKRPIRGPEGNYEVTENPDGVIASSDNAKRYGRYLDAFERVDASALVAMYIRFYPLFQQAYLELGYPKGQFNNRLLESIADLLDAPEPTTSPVLTEHKVMYEFADPALETQSAGQKVMIRVGIENERRIKSVLRAIRVELRQQFRQR